MEKNLLTIPSHYVDHKRKVVVVSLNSELMYGIKKTFVEMYPDYNILVTHFRTAMNTIIFLIGHDIDPFVGSNTLSDMAIAHIHTYHKPLLTSFPVELNGKIYLQLFFEKDLSTELLPFNYDLYELFYKEFYDVFNRNGYVVFGPESNKVNCERHKLLDDKKLWPKY